MRNFSYRCVIAVVAIVLVGAATACVEAQVTQPAAAGNRGNPGGGERGRMMELLHLQQPGPFPPATEDPRRPTGITQNPARPNLWSDAQGRNYQRSNWGTWTNYDEARAGGYTLPDPLVLKNGQPVKNAETWWSKRRQEILDDFRTEVYGKIPENIPKVTWEVTSTDPNAAGGSAIMKTVVGRIDNSRFPSANPSINITMYTPARASGPVPMIIVVSGGWRGWWSAARRRSCCSAGNATGRGRCSRIGGCSSRRRRRG